MNKNNELFICIATRYTLYSQVCIGILANTILLLLHVLTLLLEHRLKPTDLTTSHLALIHTVLQLTTGFIATDIFGSQNFWNDLTCKSVILLHRLMRELSISSTCLLSVLQAITLSPRSSCLAKFKHKSSTDSLCFFLFLWVFNTSIGGRFLISTVATPNVTSASLLFVTKSCSLWPMRYVRLTFFTLATFQDTSLIGLMVLSSGYMVSLLCRHKRQSQHLHSNRLALRASPVARATQSILLLMSFFVFIYFWDCIISTSSGLSWNNDSVHLCVQMLVGNSYAMVSPLVLISTEKRVIKFLKHMWGKDQKCSVIQR
ncbi:vomeronasal type-1 receptor 90-like [Choloepus didactylus]|uniref:vomeronasal type-1 receptor 90-like n=1 Tax=Choloepus didactylus TaxID=27675 RepID=UPI00189E9910|nr:vomeronasal type-1 receptor 90-like [Choloepus didactylus]